MTEEDEDPAEALLKKFSLTRRVESLEKETSKQAKEIKDNRRIEDELKVVNAHLQQVIEELKELKKCVMKT
jgi:hypothetical protein